MRWVSGERGQHLLTLARISSGSQVESTTPDTSRGERIEVVTSVQRRRRWLAEKLREDAYGTQTNPTFQSQDLPHKSRQRQNDAEVPKENNNLFARGHG
jgi:hypothetical protein